MHDTDTQQPIASYLEHAERVIAFVARRRRLSRDEAEEFGSVVRLKLIDDDCAILRKFGGRSSLQTYLTVVIQRLFLDFRTTAWGKWRPSAEAKRLGPTAVLLERLVARDGMSFEEASASMRTNHGVPESERDIFELSVKLPPRAKRTFTDDASLGDVLAAPMVADYVERSEHSSAATKAGKALADALRNVSEQDRLILKLRFDDGLKVSQISTMMRLEQKPLYRRIEQLLRSLRDRLEASGVDRTAVVSWLAAPPVELPDEIAGGGGIGVERPSL